MDLTDFAADVGDNGPVTVTGLGSRGGPVPGVRTVRAPVGIEWVQADEMTACCGAGTPVADLAAALADVGQRVALPDGGTVGGALAVGRSGIRRLGDGPVRDALLQTRYVSAAGEVVTAGGPTVKNVSGFDLCRALVGSRGTLGFLGDVILRTRPLPEVSQWWSAETDDPMEVFGRLYRPVSVLWSGGTLWTLLEGHPADVEAQGTGAGLRRVDGPPSLPLRHRASLPPGAVPLLRGRFVAEVGVGVVHTDDAPAALLGESSVTKLGAGGIVGESSVTKLGAGTEAARALGERVKAAFDPTGRLNPGVVVG